MPKGKNMGDRTKLKPKAEKEIRQILNRINPDLKRLLELAVEKSDTESVVVESIQTGARKLRIARRILKK